MLRIVRRPALGVTYFTCVGPAEDSSIAKDAARQRSRAAGQIVVARVAIVDIFPLFWKLPILTTVSLRLVSCLQRLFDPLISSPARPKVKQLCETRAGETYRFPVRRRQNSRFVGPRTCTLGRLWRLGGLGGLGGGWRCFAFSSGLCGFGAHLVE